MVGMYTFSTSNILELMNIVGVSKTDEMTGHLPPTVQSFIKEKAPSGKKPFNSCNFGPVTLFLTSGVGGREMVVSWGKDHLLEILPLLIASYTRKPKFRHLFCGEEGEVRVGDRQDSGTCRCIRLVTRLMMGFTFLKHQDSPKNTRP